MHQLKFAQLEKSSQDLPNIIPHTPKLNKINLYFIAFLSHQGSHHRPNQ